MGITHATGVSVRVGWHVNHLGATNEPSIQEHSIKPDEIGDAPVCSIIANQENRQELSNCFRSVNSSVPQPGA